MNFAVLGLPLMSVLSVCERRVVDPEGGSRGSFATESSMEGARETQAWPLTTAVQVAGTASQVEAWELQQGGRAAVLKAWEWQATASERSCFLAIQGKQRRGPAVGGHGGFGKWGSETGVRTGDHRLVL